MGDKFSDAGNAIRDFMTGVWDSLAGTVMGLLTLVVDLGILYVDVRWKSIVPIQVPEVLDQEVEKIKQKYEPLLKDPVNTIGGIGQSICDTADEKGVAYSSGYIVTEVVTALLADKGLDKIKNVAKTGKTADNVADIAEGAGKAAENAAEDAGKAGKGLEEAAKGAESAAEDAGKAGKTAGKVGESDSTSNYYNPDGSPIWPPNRGFDGNPTKVTLEPGTLIDRYGYDGGTFVSPKGIPYTERSLPIGTDQKPYTVFEVVKPVEVQAGKIAPWFGEKGGGIQYEFSQKISDLLQQGILRKVQN